MFKKLLAKLLRLKTTDVPPSQPTIKHSPPMFEEGARTPCARLAPARTNSNHHHVVGFARNNPGRAISAHRKVGESRSHIDTRSAEELLRDGHLRIALIGFNSRGFIISQFTRSTNLQLAEKVANLPTQIRMVPHHNVAAGLQVSLQLLSRSSVGRTGIVILTSDQRTTHIDVARKFVQTAAKRRTGVHIIQIGHDGQGRQILSDLTTRSLLGYGHFRKVQTQDELLEALRGAFDSLAPARGMTGINSAVVLLDLSEQMVESFEGTTRIEMVGAALKEHLRQPLVRPSEKRLAWAVWERKESEMASRSSRTLVVSTPS